MTVREMIESGMVEDYVLGLLDAQHREQFEKALRHSPELRAELARVENALERFAQLHAVEPPAELREQIWEAIAQSSVSLPKRPQAPTAPVVSQRWLRIIGALAVAELVLVIAGGIWLERLSARSTQQASELEQLRERYAEAVGSLQMQLSNVRDFALVMWGKAVVVPLKGTAKQPSARASVCWDTASGKLFIALPVVAPLAAHQDYQLWALVNGKPIDAGVFSPDTLRLVYPMKTINTADAFAVTIEPRGGSLSPTLSNLVLVGKLPPAKPSLTERGTR